MVEELNFPNAHAPNTRGVNSGRKPEEVQSDKTAPKNSAERGDGVQFTSRMRQWIEEVNNADSTRNERIEQVARKLRDGSLVSPESIRRSAERLIEGGP